MDEVRAASPGRRLRDALTAGPVQLPGVFNALVARIAERKGFQAIYLSGAALSTSYALPDVGLLTLSEFVAAAGHLSTRTRLKASPDPALAEFRTLDRIHQGGRGPTTA